MNRRLRYTSVPMLFAAFTLGLRPATAQRYINDGTRDKAAQDSQTAAGKLASAQLFEAMLKNAAAQSGTALEVQLGQDLEAARATWNSFQNWSWDNRDHAKDEQEVSGIVPAPGAAGDVCMAYLAKPVGGICRSLKCALESLDNALALDTQADKDAIPARLKALETRAGVLKDLLKNLKDATPSPDLKKLVDERIADINEALGFAQGLVDLKSPLVPLFDTTGKALKSIQDAFDQMAQLYGIIQAIQIGAEAVSVDPGSLRPPKAKTDLELIGADQEYLRRLGLIRARTHLIVGDIHRNISGARRLLKKHSLWTLDAPIEDTLRQLKNEWEHPSTDPQKPPRASPAIRAELEEILRALHLSAAALSAGEAVVHVSCNQEAFEYRLLSIQKKAIQSHVYEQTIKAATDRLALYWKAGIKPAELAQIIFNFTSAVSLPIIAADK